MRKNTYQAPRVEVIKVEYEGVMASSPPDFNGSGNGQGSLPNLRSNSTQPSGYSVSALGDLEDMINDFLTVGK